MSLVMDLQPSPTQMDHSSTIVSAQSSPKMSNSSSLARADSFAGEKHSKVRRMMILIITLVILFLVVAITAVVLQIKSFKSHAKDHGISSRSLQEACAHTLYPDTCIQSLSTFPHLHDPRNLLMASMANALQNVNNMLHWTNEFFSKEMNYTVKAALQDCIETLASAKQYVSYSISSFSKVNVTSWKHEYRDDITTWMSAAMTLDNTCSDGFEKMTGNASDAMKIHAEFVHKLISISLAMYVRFTSAGPISRRGLLRNGNPSWVASKRGRFLTGDFKLSWNASVAKDGSGQFRRIQDAVDAAPGTGEAFVIYIKAGVYAESVLVPWSKPNIVFVGDGIGNTVITNNKNVQQKGMTTFQSATLAIDGLGFVGRDITIENSAGPLMYQAVAARVSADKAAFYRCEFRAYQDTLYSHINRQFYRGCVIQGTIDFIFGNAAALFQDCTLLARLPLPGQANIFTAQGRMDPYQNTGFSFQMCTVAESKELNGLTQNVSSFLGRPWKDYSRTVFLKSNLGSLVDPSGWMAWDSITSNRLTTLFFGEYMNHGLGANTQGRVKWSTIMTFEQARRYTAETFITATQWLPATKIAFTIGLV